MKNKRYLFADGVFVPDFLVSGDPDRCLRAGVIPFGYISVPRYISLHSTHFYRIFDMLLFVYNRISRQLPTLSGYFFVKKEETVGLCLSEVAVSNVVLDSVQDFILFKS